jgi:hypothetical protein
LQRAQLAYPPAESIANLRVLDALSRAARECQAVDLSPERACGGEP